MKSLPRTKWQMRGADFYLQVQEASMKVETGVRPQREAGRQWSDGLDKSKGESKGRRLQGSQRQAGDKGSILFALNPMGQMAWFTHRSEVNSFPREAGRKFQGKRRSQLKNIMLQEQSRCWAWLGGQRESNGKVCVWHRPVGGGYVWSALVPWTQRIYLAKSQRYGWLKTRAEIILLQELIQHKFENMGSQESPPAFEPWLCHLPTPWPWANNSTLLISAIRPVPTSKSCYEDQMYW